MYRIETRILNFCFMKYNYKHTIFTPIYNRANQLFDLYKKMLELDYPKNDFEWIIVNDGSTDNINEVIKNFDKNRINFRIITQQNLGIHISQNNAIRNAKGEFVTRIDSDDFLLPGCLKDMDEEINKIEATEKENERKIAGIVGLCLNRKDFSVRGTKFPKDFQISTGTEQNKLGVVGDKNYCMKTEIMLKYLLPEHKDTKYFPEFFMWREIDKSYDSIFINKPFSVCTEPNSESMSGNYTGVNIRKMSSHSCMTNYYKNLYLINLGYSGSTIDKIKDMIKMFIYGKRAKTRKLNNMVKEISKKSNRALFLFILPISFAVYLFKK